MTFTGTLIEDLMATVERAEHRTQSSAALHREPMLYEQIFLQSSQVDSIQLESVLVETMLVALRFPSAPQNAEYDSNFLGVA